MNAHYKILFQGNMFAIPPLDGKRTFRQGHDLDINLYLPETLTCLTEDATSKARWGGNLLYDVGWNASQWIDDLNFDLNKVSFTQDQILYFMNMTNQFFMKDANFFITKGQKDEYYLSQISLWSGEKFTYPKDSSYLVTRWDMSDPRPLVESKKAIIFFLWN